MDEKTSRRDENGGGEEGGSVGVFGSGGAMEVGVMIKTLVIM